jgi:hypothetical protein
MEVAEVATGAVIATPVPETAAVAVAPPPEKFRLPDLAPTACGLKRTYTGVALKVAALYAIVALEPHVELLEETSKSVEEDETVIEPGAPVRLAPERFADCEALVIPTAVVEKAV